MRFKADDPMRNAKSSKNKLRFKREVGNEPALPNEVEWDCRDVNTADTPDSGVKGSRLLQL
jgi:hypothetical protein